MANKHKSKQLLAPPPSSHRPTPYRGPSRDEILALRQEYLNPGIFHYYDDPLCIVEGHMQYVWDEQGRQYLDAAGGIATISVGHCHPHVTHAVQEQVGRLAHTTTIYLHPTIVQYARKIAERMPVGSDLRQTYFGNSGSEANEYAILMARLYTGNDTILALENGYTGGTGCTMRLTAIQDWKFPADGNLEVKYGRPGYCYRCPRGLKYPGCDLECARDLENIIQAEAAGRVAGLIAEPIQGVGGVIVPPKEYFQAAYDIVRAAGGLCIADEVQTGWGRTGERFWGFENFDVVPDIVTMAKGIANGTPLSAVTTRPEIAATLTRRLHFNTFGGNPVSVAAGLATLEVIEREGLQQRARQMGAYLRSKLLELQDKHALIGEVRGLGLLQAVELVSDRRTKEPAAAETKQVVERAKELGLLLGKSGSLRNVIRLAPPMCISRDDIDFLSACLDRCLTEVRPVA